MRTSYRAVCVGALLFATTLQGQSALPPNTWPVSGAPGEIRYYTSRADLIIVNMHDALQSELAAALDRGGPAFAINSCHIDVTGLVQRIGRQ